jgi:Rrf2 family protein
MDIAERQNISEKYLESIISILSRQGFVSSLRGRGGGYKLARLPESYTVGSILKLTEASLLPLPVWKIPSTPVKELATAKPAPLAEPKQLI